MVHAFRLCWSWQFPPPGRDQNSVPFLPRVNDLEGIACGADSRGRLCADERRGRGWVSHYPCIGCSALIYACPRRDGGKSAHHFSRARTGTRNESSPCQRRPGKYGKSVRHRLVKRSVGQRREGQGRKLGLDARKRKWKVGLKRSDLRRSIVRNTGFSDLAGPPQGVEGRSNLTRMSH